MFRSLFFINILQWKEWGPLEETAKSTSESGEKQDKPEASCIGWTEGISHERRMDEACQKDEEVNVKIS